MTWSVVALDEVAAVPWRNAGGRTRELLAWPSAVDWRIRMSVADVERDGPFSLFVGIERGFAVLEGAGVILQTDAAPRRLTKADEPWMFDGAAAVQCGLIDGPTRDFNLMAAPGCGRLQRVRGLQRLPCKRAHLVALYTHSGPAQMTVGGDGLALPARGLAWRIFEADGVAQVEAADALWVEVRL